VNVTVVPGRCFTLVSGADAAPRGAGGATG
jgi:hypothetical protein